MDITVSDRSAPMHAAGDYDVVVCVERVVRTPRVVTPAGHQQMAQTRESELPILVATIDHVVVELLLY